MKICKKNPKAVLRATEDTFQTFVFNNFVDEENNRLKPSESIQKNSVNKAIKFVKMGNVRAAEKAIKPAINYLMSMKGKKISLGCTELPIGIFAFKSFKKIKSSKIFLDPNLILAESAMTKHKN